MRVLLVHPSALMYSELYLRLEPIGLERGGVRAAGHEVRMLDLQIFSPEHARESGADLGRPWASP
jgi:magnesium-protoporphyrin IX monomethyl ester (oxidative) cyclase